ncbi:MAG: hypothetical protein FRX49_05365 [Trebouxia sp. A1-2]|nr:MAG: hypothetical protein FRX49_05365 [Trebouxia sp. A1-2]
MSPHGEGLGLGRNVHFASSQQGMLCTTGQSRLNHKNGSMLTKVGHGELGEVHQHLCHLIASLTTADIDDAITVTVLGERLGNDRLAAPKSPRNGTRQKGVATPPTTKVERAGHNGMAVPPGTGGEKGRAEGKGRALPPSTEGKRASSTRWPVSNGVLASSFCATGRGERTGHA